MMKNLKFRLREPQQYLFMFGFPVMFVTMFWVMFRGMEAEGHTVFDMFIWSVLGFTTAFATQSASVAFSQEKESGTLKRLLTTPLGSKGSIFTGFILSEIVIITIQIGIVYVLAFLGLDVYFSSVPALLANFGVYLLLAFVCIGIGLILAAVLSAKLAGQLPMIIIMPMVMLSGTFVPINSPVIYATPVFWASQFAQEIGVRGSDLLSNVVVHQLGGSPIPTDITLWWSIPILGGFALVFMAAGLFLFSTQLQE